MGAKRMATKRSAKGTKVPLASPAAHVTPIGDVPIYCQCRHSQYDDDDFYRCWHPLTQQPDMVTGPRPVYCTTARACEPCGYEGKLFEAKRSLLARVSSLFTRIRRSR